jgi:hypothetical protein
MLHRVMVGDGDDAKPRLGEMLEERHWLPLAIAVDGMYLQINAVIGGDIHERASRLASAS